MERVTFLVEDTGTRISCLLNPDSIVMRRASGIARRKSASGPLTGYSLNEDPILCTGGGWTELTLDLLFDVSLAGTSLGTNADDVRNLTAPLWELSENSSETENVKRPPVIRFVWGKNWNIPGIVASVAERLECFAPSGQPRRSWLRMKVIRIDEPARDEDQTAPLELPMSLDLDSSLGTSDQIPIHEYLGGADPMSEKNTLQGERIDSIAARHYGNPSYWRLIADFNGLNNPLDILTGAHLRLPPLSVLRGAE
jgi:hypothetical protein